MRATQHASRPPRNVAAPGWVLWAIVGIVSAPALVKTAADPDLWGHVRFGLDVLSNHALPVVDPYSFTQDVRWINHEWLSELLMAAAYSAGGATGLSVLRGVLVASFIVLVLGAHRRAAPAALVGAAALLIVGTVRQTLSFRPQIFTLIAIAVLCRLFVSGPRRSWLIAVPALFLFWANLHGGWIVGAALLAVWTAFEMVRPHADRRLAAGVAVLSALATLVNPYGWHMWTFLASTVRMSRAITEWQPILAAPLLVQITWILVIVAVVALAVTKPRPPADRLAMVVLLAHGAFRVQRLTPLCVAAALVLMSPIVAERWPSRTRALGRLTRVEARALAIAVIVAAIVSGAAVLRAASCIVVAGEWAPDSIAGRALAATDARGRIVTYFAWGEYAIWHFAPRLRVSIDGRRETVYSEATLARHDALEAATPEGLAYLQQLDPMYVWEPATFTRLRDWLATHGYRIDIRTDKSYVAVRADLPILLPVDRQATECFPGP